jgi:hypothetical protein
MGLTFDELEIAAHAGTDRELRALRLGRKHRYGYAPVANWTTHIEAAIAEATAAKWRGYKWVPTADTDAAGDIAPGVQVRHSLRLDGHMPLHPPDPADHAYVFVVGAGLGQRIVGWCWGYEGKQERYWRADLERPCFFVPQSVLRWLPAKNGNHEIGEHDG